MHAKYKHLSASIFFNKCSYVTDSTKFRIAKLQRFQTYINYLRLIKIIDEILILSLFSNPFTFFCNFCQAPGPSQRRLDSRPQSIMGIECLIPRVASLTVDCRGVDIILTKPIWKLFSNDKYVRYFVKTAHCNCCIIAILIMTCVLLYQVYLF